jgi:hypothetical protein
LKLFQKNKIFIEMNLQQSIRKHLNETILENERKMTENYMFFSNLQQIQRQCEMLLKMDPNQLDSIIKNGHDWADDHVSEAKNNMDQVFDFFMNETKKEDNVNEAYSEIDESKNCPTDPAKWAASKAKAKAKFDVYPSAYANGFAAKDYKSKGGGWKKCK